MAGMFYSLEEVAAKLGKTEEDIRHIVKEGRLREFRDGANLLFKVDEVEALMSDTSFMAAKIELSAPSESEIELELEPEPELEPETAPELEPELEPEIAPEIEPELAAIEEEFSLTPESTEEEISLKPESTEEEVSLAPESIEEDIIAESGLTDEANLTSADTALADEGTNILGETATDFQLGDDMMGETKAASDLLAGSSGEVSLEEIEEDVNLDTFGSGSGLLDLSLQADDTSLGGILDEIYTPEGEQGKESPEGTEMELPAEPEEMLEEHEAASPQPAPAAATAQAYLEPEPDTASNMLGYMIFLPLLAVIYTTIVAVASSRGVMPTIVEEIQGMIWYITGGLAVVAAIMGGAAFTMGGGGTKTAKKAKPKKAKKEKKPKKEKKKKEKKKK